MGGSHYKVPQAFQNLPSLQDIKLHQSTRSHQSTPTHQDQAPQGSFQHGENSRPLLSPEEERVYNFLWGGSIYEKSMMANSPSLERMNKIYDAHKKKGHSEEEIYQLHDGGDPLLINPGLLRDWQRKEKDKHLPQWQRDKAILDPKWGFVLELKNSPGTKG